MEFHVYATSRRSPPGTAIAVIPSNNEKGSSTHSCAAASSYIKLPDRETMQAIIDVHFRHPDHPRQKALDIFYQVRDVRPQEEAFDQQSRLAGAALHETCRWRLQSRDTAKAIPLLRRPAQERAG
jgi:hypothetical protein